MASQGDKDIAGVRANTVSGVFSVDNKLRVEASSYSCSFAPSQYLGKLEIWAIDANGTCH